MAPTKRKRPSQASGQAPKPSKRQAKAPAKHPWDKGYKVIKSLNPFD